MYLVQYNFGTLAGEKSWKEKQFANLDEAKTFTRKHKGASLFQAEFILQKADYTDPEGRHPFNHPYMVGTKPRVFSYFQ